MKISSAQPYFSEADIKAVLTDFEKVLNGKMTLGPYVKEFERGFARYTGSEYAVAVHSATNALEIALRYFDLNGAEVIVPADTFIATANSVILAGGKPIIADIDAATLALNVETIKSKITTRTKGIIIVHMMGFITPEMNEIVDFCREKNLFLIEDAAHAHGSSIDGRKAGTLADAGCFSFYPTKLMTTGEGGVVTTNNSGLAKFARSFRHHGMDLTGSATNCIRVGSNYRMDEFRAVLGLHQLRRLESFLEKRSQVAALYREKLEGLEGVSLLPEFKNIRNSYWKFPVFFETRVEKEMAARAMKEAGIDVNTPYSPLCHQHTMYQKEFGCQDGDCPVAENIVERYFCLPMHCALSDEEVSYVINCMEEHVCCLK